MLIRRSEQTQSQPQMAAKTPPPPPPPLSPEEELFGSETQPNVLTKSTTAKRPAADTATKEAKKQMKTFNFLHRIWSEEDEIVILKGLIDYTSEKRSDPLSELDDFHDFIKEKLTFDATRAQLQSKIRKMKNRYEMRIRMKEVYGKVRRFSNSHDQKTYDLSEMVWGNGEKMVWKTANKKVNAAVKSKKEKNAAVEDVKKNAAVKIEKGKNAAAVDVKKSAAVKIEKVKNAAAVKSVEGKKKLAPGAGAGAKRVMSTEERMLIAGRELYELGEEGEEEWQELKVEELELYQKEMEVKAAQMKVRIEQTKLVLDGLKGGRITSF